MKLVTTHDHWDVDVWQTFCKRTSTITGISSYHIPQWCFETTEPYGVWTNFTFVTRSTNFHKFLYVNSRLLWSRLCRSIFGLLSCPPCPVVRDKNETHVTILWKTMFQHYHCISLQNEYLLFMNVQAITLIWVKICSSVKNLDKTSSYVCHHTIHTNPAWT